MAEDMAAELGDEGDLQHMSHQGTILCNSYEKRDFLVTLSPLSSSFGILCFSRKWSELLLPCSFGLMISSAYAEQTGSIQSTTVVNPNIWGTREYVKSAAVITVLAGLMATIIRIARRTINPRRQVPASTVAFYTNPTLQKTRTPFPIIPAISPILGTAPDNAIDDALARTPAPRRNNSPLSWL